MMGATETDAQMPGRIVGKGTTMAAGARAHPTAGNSISAERRYQYHSPTGLVMLQSCIYMAALGAGACGSRFALLRQGSLRGLAH